LANSRSFGRRFRDAFRPLKIAAAANSGPYGQGWFVSVLAPDLKVSLRNLLNGSLARKWTILTFLFGEAQLGGKAAVVSLHRLRDEFYGLPPNILALRERLLKEAVHELGHTLSLPHCEDYQCVMSASHGIALVDLKSSRFCRACRDAVPSSAELKALNGSAFQPSGRKVP
jgi:Peptidase family M54